MYNLEDFDTFSNYLNGLSAVTIISFLKQERQMCTNCIVMLLLTFQYWHRLWRRQFQIIIALRASDDELTNVEVCHNKDILFLQKWISGVRFEILSLNASFSFTFSVDLFAWDSKQLPQSFLLLLSSLFPNHKYTILKDFWKKSFINPCDRSSFPVIWILLSYFFCLLFLFCCTNTFFQVLLRVGCSPCLFNSFVGLFLKIDFLSTMPNKKDSQ